MYQSMAVPFKKVHSLSEAENEEAIIVKRLKRDVNVCGASSQEKVKKMPKLQQFRSEPLEDSVDYMSLQSSLSLLYSRLRDIKHDMKELNSLKQSINASEDVKSITKLIRANSDYLNEISYKGCFTKCPEISWKNDYDIDLDVLKKNNDDDDDDELTKINDNYEIIKRDQLFCYSNKSK